MTKQTTVPRRSANMSHALRIFEIDSSAIASYNIFWRYHRQLYCLATIGAPEVEIIIPRLAVCEAQDMQTEAHCVHYKQ